MDRALTWLHRWSGVVLCLVFLMWFVSGAVLHFVGFPALPDAERYVRSAAVDPARVDVAPGAALAQHPDASALRLIAILDRPVYALSTTSGWVTVAADGGEPPTVDANTARAIALRFATAGSTPTGAAHASNATPAFASISGPFDYDQWIVHQHFDGFRPFWRVSLGDADGTDLYVSARTGEVLQKTRGRERVWNWVGANLHWIYFTGLRKNWSAWNQVVWWGSLLALLTTCIGAWLGIVRAVRTHRAGHASLSPFRAWLRWHHLIGLFTSAIVLLWIFSGWLSMDHGRLFSRGYATPAQIQAVRGLPLERIAGAFDVDKLRAAGGASEYRFNAVGGLPFVTLRGARPARLYWPQDGATTVGIAPSLLQAAIQSAWSGAKPLTGLSKGTARTFQLAEGFSDRVAGFVTPDAAATAIYVDTLTGELPVVMDRSRRAYAWTYYALHTLNFPGLNDRPALRTALVLALLAIGTLFSATGVVIGVKRLARTWQATSPR